MRTGIFSWKGAFMKHKAMRLFNGVTTHVDTEDFLSSIVRPEGLRHSP